MDFYKFISKIIFIIILVLNEKFILTYIKKNYIYFFCEKCANEKTISSECYKCEPDLFFKSIKLISRGKTVNELIENKKSIARFGDGEFKIIFGKNVGFQIYNKTLKDKLLKVLKSNKNNLLIGIPQLYNMKNKHWVDFIEKYKFELVKIINKNKVYYHSGITRIFHQLVIEIF